MAKNSTLLVLQYSKNICGLLNLNEINNIYTFTPLFKTPHNKKKQIFILIIGISITKHKCLNKIDNNRTD